MWAKLVIVHNPFRPTDRESVDIEIPLAGLPVVDVCNELPDIPDCDWVVTVNGAKPPEDFIIQPGSCIVCCPVPQKDAMRLVLQVVVVVLAAWIGSLVSGPYGVYWGYAAAAAVSVVGNYAVNALLPPTAPDMPQLGMDAFNESPTYGWGQLAPTRGQGHPIPILYGTHKVSGQILSKSVTPSGNNQMLNVMMSVGHGPITSMTDIRVKDQPVSYFRNITTYTRLGTPNDALVPGFDEIPTLNAVGVKLTPTAHQVTTAGNAVESLRIDLAFPAGLYAVYLKKGYNVAASVNVHIDYQKVGDSIWTEHPVQNISALSIDPVRRTIEISGLEPSDYNVRVRRGNPESTSQYTRDSCFWSSSTEIIKQNLIYPGLAKYAITALATDQLSGSEPTFTCLAARDTVQVYNPGLSGYEPRDATNPAWAAYDLLHNEEYGGNIPYTRIDFDAFLDMADYCDELVAGLPRHTCNIYLDSPSELWQHCQAILQLGRAIPIRRGAIYSVVVDKPSTPVQLFTVGNIVGQSFNLSYLATKERANAMEISFLDAGRDYTRQPIAAYSSDYNDSDSRDNKASMRFFGCTNRAEVLREAAFRLNSTKWTTRTVNFAADIDAIACQVGDLVFFQHDAPTWSEGGRVFEATIGTVTLDKEVEVDLSEIYKIIIRLDDDTLVERVVTPAELSTRNVFVDRETGEFFDTDTGIFEGAELILVTDTFDVPTPFIDIPTKYCPYMIGTSTEIERIYRVVNIEKDSDLTRKISAVEYVEAIYSDTGFIFDEPLWDPKVQEAVNVDIAEAVTIRDSDGSYETHMNVTWTPAFLAPGYAWAIWLEDTTAANAPTRVGQTDNLHFVIPSTGLLLGHSYKVYITRSDQGAVDSGQNTATVTLAGEFAPPADVLAFTGGYIPQTRSVNFSWDEVEDLDLDYYEIRQGGTDWDTATVVIEKAVGTTATLYIEDETNTTLTFRIKAVDTTGRYSENQGAVSVAVDTSSTTIPVPTGLTLTTGSQIESDGTEKVWVRATWDANAEVTDQFAYYDLVITKDSSGWMVTDSTKNNEFTWYISAATDYTIQLRSVDKNENYSAWDTDYVTSSNDSTPPATIAWTALASCVPGFKLIALRWIKSDADDIATYAIERATDAGFTDAEEIARVRTNYFVDTQLDVGAEYFYRVKGVDTSKNLSVAWSTTRSATTLEVGTSDIAANAIIANHISTTELFAMIIQSADYSDTPGSEQGFKIDAVNEVAQFFDMDVDTVNGAIIVRNSGTDDFAELTEGNLKFWYSDGSGGHVLYNSIRRIETNGAPIANGALVTVPGLWKNLPKISVTPRQAKLFVAAYSNQDQTFNCYYANLSINSGVVSFNIIIELALDAGQVTTNPVSNSDTACVLVDVGSGDDLGNMLIEPLYVPDENGIQFYLGTAITDTITNTANTERLVTQVQVGGGSGSQLYGALAWAYSNLGDYFMLTDYRLESVFVKITLVLDVYYDGSWHDAVRTQTGIHVTGEYTFDYTAPVGKAITQFRTRISTGSVYANEGKVKIAPGNIPSILINVTEYTEYLSSGSAVIANGTADYVAIGE